MKTAKKIALIIKHRRGELGLSQKALADKVGVSRQCITAWEQARPEESIRASNLASLEKALEYNPGDLLKLYCAEEEA